MEIGLEVWMAGILLVAVQVLIAIQTHFLFPDDMVKHHGVGLPFIYDFGALWSDLLFISPWCGLVVAFYSDQWVAKDVHDLGVAGFGLSAIMHWIYRKDPIRNVHVDGGLTPAIGVHFLFMWPAFTIIGLFFLHTHDVQAWAIITSAVLLWVHVVIASRLLNKIAKRWWFTPDLSLVDAGTLGQWVAAALGLAGFSWYALN